MRLGIVGSPADLQVGAVAAKLRSFGAAVAIVDPTGLERGEGVSSDGHRFFFGGDPLDDVGAFWLRHSPKTMPPTFTIDERYVLFDDWFARYMALREQHGFFFSWLIERSHRGVPIINPVELAAQIQLKPFQLSAASARGLALPRTCITNDPARVHAFVREIGRPGDVVFKPTMGGALVEVLDEVALARLGRVTRAPVTFQEKIIGDNVRLTVVDDEVVSAVRIPADTLDFRADDAYRAGATVYEGVDVPDEVAAGCRALLKDVGLVISGIDFIVRDGVWFFLEANPAPIWLDIEQKTGAGISTAIAALLLRLSRASGAERLRARLAEAGTTSSFCRYAYPQNPRRRMA